MALQLAVSQTPSDSCPPLASEGTSGTSVVQTHTNRISLIMFLLTVVAKNLEKDILFFFFLNPPHYLLLGVKSVVCLSEKECKINMCKSL